MDYPTEKLGGIQEPLSAAGGERVRPRPRRYSQRFKIRAVKLVIDEGVSVAQVARELGISRSSVRRWKRDLREAVTPPRPPVLEPAPAVRDDRQAILAGHLDELQVICRETAGPERKKSFLQGLALDHWERALLRSAFGPVEQRSYLARLVAQGTALRAKVLEEIERLDGGEPLFEELIANAAVGLALIEEMQEAIDHLIGVGQISQAKRLTGFRTKIRQPIFRIVDRIGREGLEKAQAISQAMITVVPADEMAVSEKTARPPSPRRLPTKRLPARPPQQVDRRRPLLIALAASLFAALLIGLPQLGNKSTPAELSGAAAREVTIRRPFVRPAVITPEVGPVSLKDISLPDRRRLLRQIDAAATNAPSDEPETLSGRTRDVGR